MLEETADPPSFVHGKVGKRKRLNELRDRVVKVLGEGGVSEDDVEDVADLDGDLDGGDGVGDDDFREMAKTMEDEGFRSLAGKGLFALLFRFFVCQFVLVIRIIWKGGGQA